MKAFLALSLKKARTHVFQLIGLMLLITVGTGFFITLFTIKNRYEETTEKYFIDNLYADVTFFGNFNPDSIKNLKNETGILSAKGRRVEDFRTEERVFRAITLTEGINELYIYEGELPKNKSECVLLKRNADAMDLSIGDIIDLGDYSVKITGLAASPEYIYLVQNERVPMAEPAQFGVFFVSKDFFGDSYNEIVALTDGTDAKTLAEKLNADYAITQNELPNVVLYKSDLDQISSFAYIFPIVFVILIAVVIAVMLSRLVQKERKQIGVMKALGTADAKIAAVYLIQFGLTAVIGALLGCTAAAILSNYIIDIFKSMFEVPALKFVFYPKLWIFAVIMALSICTASGYMALRGALNLLPAAAIRAKSPQGGRRLLIETMPVWNRFNFNTRYAVKSSLRNKGRFIAVVVGMCGSCALMVFSLGFYNSIGNTQDRYFEDFARYDAIVNVNPMSYSKEHPVSELMDAAAKTLMQSVKIRGENCTLIVANSDFDMVNIPKDKLNEGIILPEYYADLWNVSEGDVIQIDSFDAIVSAVAPQYLGIAVYTGYDYAKKISKDLPYAYNTIYGRKENLSNLTDYLKRNNISYTTAADDKAGFASIIESTSVLIWFLIGCSVTLGFAVMYSVGLINLSAREFEYMFMNVMGYKKTQIMLAHLKETVLQLVISIPLGFVLGNVLLESIKGEFSGSSFVIASAIYLESYVISAVSVIIVSLIMAAVTNHHVEGLDVVMGLKEQED